MIRQKLNEIAKGVEALKRRIAKKRGEIIDSGHSDHKSQEESSAISSNKSTLMLQSGRVVIGLIVALAVVAGLVIFVQGKAKMRSSSKNLKPETIKLELAEKAVDGEILWQTHQEDEMRKLEGDLKKKIEEARNEDSEQRKQMLEDTRDEINGLKEQLKMAQLELAESNRAIQGMYLREEERGARGPVHEAIHPEMIEFGEGFERDVPKSAANYIPEGTYFTGYLLGGIVVSTALNTPDENATPLTIRLTDRGNLSKANGLDISKCRILGSCYGDISSERAVIRLEKMICEEDDMYITSNIAGDVHGPDGFNGIKGEVVSTGSKHIKNAMMGGLVSGLTSSAKGQDSLNITSGGLVSTKEKKFKDMATAGVMSGVSNAGDKIAEYYLRQAESMSPVLTIPGGVRVNAHITKGFFVGQLDTRKKIKADREKNRKARSESRKQEQEPVQAQAQSQEEYSSGEWKAQTLSGGNNGN